MEGLLAVGAQNSMELFRLFVRASTRIPLFAIRTAVSGIQSLEHDQYVWTGTGEKTARRTKASVV